MKKLKDNEIKKIKKSLKPKFKKSVLRTARDNFHTMYTALESKIHLDDWTEDDKIEILQAFRQGCDDATKKTCAVVFKEFHGSIEKYEGYEQNEYCKCCFFNEFCAGNPVNRGEDHWHYNFCLIWENLFKGPFDLDYIKDKFNKMENSSGLQDLHNLVEGW